MVETVRCDHCGAETKHPVTKMIDGRALNFCCMGCLGVYELLREEGAPAGQSGPGAPAHSRAAQASSGDPQPTGTPSFTTVRLRIAGMTCANCVTCVEKGLLSVPGVLSASVDLATGGARVEVMPAAATLADLRQAVHNAGYDVADTGDSGEEPGGREQKCERERRGLVSKVANVWKRGPNGGRRIP